MRELMWAGIGAVVFYTFVDWYVKKAYEPGNGIQPKEGWKSI